MLRLAPNVVTARTMAVQSAPLPSRRTKDWPRLAEERTGGSEAWDREAAFHSTRAVRPFSDPCLS
jgi:hypothetical protein